MPIFNNNNKVIAGLLLLLSSVCWGQQNVNVPNPSNVYYIPLPESTTTTETFRALLPVAGDEVFSIIAFAISTDGTVVWYDHHEDGYETFVDEPVGTTEVWGDGNCTNGHAPGTTCVNDSDDQLIAGQSIIVQDLVDILETIDPGCKDFGGGDKVVASHPIAITRAMYPNNIGAEFAGAVEVLSVKNWGYKYVAPGAESMPSQELTSETFEHTRFYVQAREDNTVITYYDEYDVQTGTVTLNEGETDAAVVPTIGTYLVADKKVQVHLLTGDIGDHFEQRWFQLLPFEDWSNDYVSPTGDSEGENRILMYNPNDFDILVEYDVIKSPEDPASPDHGEIHARNRTIGANNWKFTDIIGYGSGCRLTSEHTFYALSITDAPSGRNYDWGYPLMPMSRLTSHVLVGWGWGCTGQFCGFTPDWTFGSSRNVVWITPVEDADIYIDLDNDGTFDLSQPALAYQSIRIEDTTGDNDMSGALVWAVKSGYASDSTETVKIAGSWGQDACLAYEENDVHAMDLGTLIPPLDVVGYSAAAKVSGTSTSISPGETVDINIVVQNHGQADLTNVRIERPSLVVDEYCTAQLNGGSVAGCASYGVTSSNKVFTVDLPRRVGALTINYRYSIPPGVNVPPGIQQIVEDIDTVLLTNDETKVIVPQFGDTQSPTPNPTPAPTPAPITTGTTPNPTPGPTPDNGISPPPNFIGACVQDNRRGLFALEEKWNISDFEFFYDWNHFEFDFEINGQINDLAQVRGVIFHDDCTTPYNGTALTINKRPFYGAGGLGKHNQPLNVTVDPLIIAQDELYIEDTTGFQVTAGIEFCLRYSLYTPPVPGEEDIEVNFLEIITRLSIDLTDGFAVDEFNVAPKNICEEQAEDAFGVEAYFCEKGNEADDTYAPLALNQGDLVRICVRPNSEARELGLRMRRVRNATFTMGELTQRAILEISQPAANGLTEVGCVPGYGICWFETLLFAPFFAAPGFVQCEGAADLQFGGQPINSVSPWGFTRRALRGDEDYLDTNTFDRGLQDEDAPTATFEVGANVNRGPKYGASGASTTTVMRSLYYVGAAAVLVVSYLF